MNEFAEGAFPFPCGDAVARERGIVTEEVCSLVVTQPKAIASTEGMASDALDMLHWLGTHWSVAPPIDGYTGPLPGMLAEIDRLIGRRLTLEFLKGFGGSRVTFPKPGGWQDGNRIVAAVGEEAAFKLCEEYSGPINWTIPLGPLSYDWMRSIAVRALLCHGGFSVAKIAHYCRMTERGVYKHRSTLVEFGVLQRRVDEVRPQIPSQHAMVSLLLESGTKPAEVARQLDLPPSEVERQADAKRRADAKRASQ